MSKPNNIYDLLGYIEKMVELNVLPEVVPVENKINLTKRTYNKLINNGLKLVLSEQAMELFTACCNFKSYLKSDVIIWVHKNTLRVINSIDLGNVDAVSKPTEGS